MYNYTHQWLLSNGNNPHSHKLYKNKTVLTAIFSFDKEVPPNQREEIKKRCSLNSRRQLSKGVLCIEEGLLDAFMKRNLNYQPSYTQLLMGKEYTSNREIVRITPFLWGIGFHLKSEARGPMSLDKMINLDAIDEFVLTGKFSPKTEQQLQEQQA